ncbi:lectizyme-like [Cochliomyia hominivorax]
MIGNNIKYLVGLVVIVANVSSLKVVSRIINGHNAAKGAAPYIVSLKKGSHFCAGSIIDEHWVLTAAHCLNYYDSFEVVAGLHERFNESEAQIRQVPNRNVQIINENYKGEVAPFDIGLIYIDKPFDFESFAPDGTIVAKINLPFGEYDQPKRARVFGWGYTNSGILPNVLQTLDVDIIDNAECAASFPGDLGKRVDPETNICSLTPGVTDGTCNGDSGGPLVRLTPNGPEHLGLVSWGYAPCLTKYPSVFTRTSAYTDWIHETINNFNPDNIAE